MHDSTNPPRRPFPIALLDCARFRKLECESSLSQSKIGNRKSKINLNQPRSSIAVTEWDSLTLLV